MSSEKLEKHILNQQQAFETEKQEMKERATHDLSTMKAAMATAARKNHIHTAIILHSKSLIRNKMNDSLAKHSQTRDSLDKLQSEYDDYKH